MSKYYKIKINIFFKFVQAAKKINMPMQFIKDNEGSTTAVVIPIEEWKQITTKHNDLKQLEQKQSLTLEKMKPSDFAGILSEETYIDITRHLKQVRSEWDRDIY